MPPTTHTLRTAVSVRFTPSSGADPEYAEALLEITYTYHPGAPAMGPTYSHGGLPADPPELSLISAKFLDGEISPAPWDDHNRRILEWADDYLNTDEGYSHACSYAESERT